MSHAPSTLGSMTTSSFSPTAPTISITSSSIHGELRALIRVHRPVVPKSFAFAMAMKPARAACLASAGIASSKLPSTTSTSAISSGTLARNFSICGGTKWIMRSSLTGSSRSGVGAPTASGLKKLRGSFMGPNSFSNHGVCLGLRQAPARAAGATIVALQRLAAHETRLGCPRRHTLLHDRPTQWADALDQKKRGSAHPLKRQKIRKQAAVEEVDRQHAARRIGAPHAIVALAQRPEVVSLPMGCDDQFADGRSVAQAEIETLRADRRNDVGRFADERNSPDAEMGGGRACQREGAAASFELDLAQDRMRAPFDLGAHLRIGERRLIGDLGWVGHEDQARTSLRQRHERKRPRLGMELS